MNELLKLLLSDRGRKGSVASYRGLLLLTVALGAWQLNEIKHRITLLEFRMSMGGIAQKPAMQSSLAQLPRTKGNE